MERVIALVTHFQGTKNYRILNQSVTNKSQNKTKNKNNRKQSCQRVKLYVYDAKIESRDVTNSKVQVFKYKL